MLLGQFRDGRRKSATCKGSFSCENSNCIFQLESGEENSAHFKTESDDKFCNLCGQIMTFRPYYACKIWEFQEEHVIVKHFGYHTCVLKPKQTKIDFKERPNTVTKGISF